jgi:all-trans-retinol 13,14-reductase
VLGDTRNNTMRKYPVTSGSREKYIDNLKSQFPKEHAAIDKYMALIDQVRNEIKGFVSVKFMPSWMSRLLLKTGLVHFTTNYFKLAQRTLSEVLSELTEDKELRAVLVGLI